MSSVSRKRAGFTLVELLVVIGIIAVLISILLPSLARARQQALLVSCQANLRTVYQALMLYADSNKGYLPYAEVPGATGDNTWSLCASSVLGTDTKNGRRAQYLKCPSALPEWGWDANQRWDYIPNPRLVPKAIGYNLTTGVAVNPGDVDAAYGKTRPPVARQLATVVNPTEKFLVWDGAQTMTWNYNPMHFSIFMDGWAWFGWNHKFCDPPNNPSYTGMDQELPIGSSGNAAENVARNRDGTDFFECGMRFRHLDNKVVSVVFADGHGETRTLGSVKRRDVCVNYK